MEKPYFDYWKFSNKNQLKRVETFASKRCATWISFRLINGMKTDLILIRFNTTLLIFNKLNLL